MTAAEKEKYDFPVELQPMLDNYGNPVPRFKNLVRTDTQHSLTVVSDNYRLFTHKQAVDATKGFLDHFGNRSVRNWVEGDGKRFVHQSTYDLATSVNTPALKDTVKLQLTMVNSYDKQSSLRVRICAQVLSCLNGMTVPGGALDLSFRHTGSIEEFKLPDPELVLRIFKKAGEEWNEWADRVLSPLERESILKHAMQIQIIGQKAVKAHNEKLEAVPKEITAWEYFNNFTNVLTHHAPRVRQSNKLTRFDRLRAIFDRVLHGTPDPGFNDEEHE